MWSAAEGSATVFVNGKPLVRLNDQTRHCGGQGKMIEGSDNVIVGGSPSSSGGAAGGAAAAGSGSVAGGAPGVASGAGAKAGADGKAAAASPGGSVAATRPDVATPGSGPAAANAGQPAEAEDSYEEVTFQVAEHALDEGHPSGVSVVIEFADGRRQTVKTNGSGNVKTLRKRGEAFRVVSIDEKEGGGA